MKYFKLQTATTMFTVVCSVLFSHQGNAQIAADYEVATWYQFKTAAVSYTFDDNTSKQIPVAIPMFDLYNFKVTLNTVTSWSPNWDELKKASMNGHEVASHTISHPVLNTLSITDQEKELQESQSAINTNITNTKCLTIAYPNCVLGDLPTIQKYYIAGRICSGTIIPPKPSDFYRLSSIIAGTQGSVKTALDFNTKVASAKASKGWCVFLIHGIDDDGGWSPVQSTELGTHLKFMNDNTNDYWVETFGNVVKYIRERNALSLVETAVTSDSLKLTASDNLDHEIYNVPVTVRRLLPTDWPNAHVYAGDKLITSVLSTVGIKKYIVFDVVPGQNELFLSKSNEQVLGYSSLDKMTPVLIGPNPFSQVLKIETTGIFHYFIHGLDGKLIEEGNCNHSAMAGQHLHSGIYMLLIRNEKEFYRTKIIKI
jgi:oligosaccharide reducing-end xylanase